MSKEHISLSNEPVVTVVERVDGLSRLDVPYRVKETFKTAVSESSTSATWNADASMWEVPASREQAVLDAMEDTQLGVEFAESVESREPSDSASGSTHIPVEPDTSEGFEKSELTASIWHGRGRIFVDIPDDVAVDDVVDVAMNACNGSGGWDFREKLGGDSTVIVLMSLSMDLDVWVDALREEFAVDVA